MSKSAVHVRPFFGVFCEAFFGQEKMKEPFQQERAEEGSVNGR
jgi:hypothetical protein